MQPASSILQYDSPKVDESPCSQCKGMPCRDTLRGSGLLPFPQILSPSLTLPLSCPALACDAREDEIRRALFRMPDGERAALWRRLSIAPHVPSTSENLTDELLRLIRSRQVTVLFPQIGSPIESFIRSAVAKRLGRAHAHKPKSSEAEGDVAASEEEAPKPVLVNPVWAWLANPKKKGCDEKTLSVAAIGDAVWCKVDSQGLMPGDSVAFNIFLKGRNGKSDERVTTVFGRVGENRDDEGAVGRFVIGETVLGQKLDAKKDQLYFIAKQATHSLEIKGPNLALEEVWRLWLQIDLDHPKAKDDELILLNEGGGEVKRLKFSELSEAQEDFVELRFEGIDRDAKYSLMRDYGPDEGGGKEYLFEEMKPSQIDAQWS